MIVYKLYVPVFLSRVMENWFNAGGTFILLRRTRLWRCILTYLGHLTKRVKSRGGWMAMPIPKLRVLASNKGRSAFFRLFF